MIELKTNNKIFGGWLSASVTRSLNAVSGSFEISYIDQWEGQSDPWQIKAGDLCSLSFDDNLLITGFVDEISASYSSDSRTLSISGRDRTGDLVDSASLIQSKNFRGVSLASMANTLAAPFGVSVTSRSKAANTSIKNVSAQATETVWESISKLAKYQGVLAYPDSNGGIVFADVGTEVIASLVQGENILSCSVTQNESEKFQTYKIYITEGNEDIKHKIVVAEVKDNSVKRPRVKMISTKKNITMSEAVERIKWEMASKIAKAFTLNITVTSWLTSKNKLWEINKLVSVKSPKCGIDGNFLIEETKFVFDEDGYKTELKLVVKDAYKPQTSRSGSDVGKLGEV
jgi:prophage tail gpP-like protein